MTNRDCLFCKIISGEIKAEIVANTELVMAFPDINPVYETHILIVPKKHIDSVLTIKTKDSKDLVAMYNVAADLVAKNKLDAFRLTFNGGRFQHVPHLHMHLGAGKKLA